MYRVFEKVNIFVKDSSKTWLRQNYGTFHDLKTKSLSFLLVMGQKCKETNVITIVLS